MLSHSVWLVSFGSVVRAMLAGHLDTSQSWQSDFTPEKAEAITAWKSGLNRLLYAGNLEHLRTLNPQDCSILCCKLVLKPATCYGIVRVSGESVVSRCPGKGSVDLLQVSAFSTATKVGSASENAQPVRGMGWISTKNRSKTLQYAPILNCTCMCMCI